jgi:hypothetical protein
MLRSARATGYGASKKPDGDGGGSRSFPLMDGEDVPDGPCCVKVYGQAQDGKFVIDRIEPEQGKSNEDAIMVRNATQLSPS